MSEKPSTPAALEAFAEAALLYFEAPSDELRRVCEVAAMVLRAAREKKVG